ncbi:10517_t:CDS:10, partial [Diversispora eburnea]
RKHNSYSTFGQDPKATSVYTHKNAEVSFTTDKYLDLKRNPNFSELTQEDITFFQSILPSNSIIVGNEDDLLPYNIDWMRKYRGKSKLIAKPRTTKQISEILKYCNDRRLAVVPQGGNTGLVGGGVPVFDEIVISINNLNKIRSFDHLSGSLVCDGGCILENLDNYLAEKGFMMPLDLGAKGSCQIGGNVATNAGGLRLLRYGSLHGSVLGLEVVLPDGTVLDNLVTLRKDNTGYDIKQLFIGSEGTLGIITGVSIQTPRKPKAVNVVLLGLNSFEKVQETFIRAKDDLTEILSAFEFWDANSVELIQAHIVQGSKFPLNTNYPFYILIEVSGSNKVHNDEKLSNFLEDILEKQTVEDGVVAQDETQAKVIWAIREGIPEACSKSGAVYKYDVSMPLEYMYKLVEDLRLKLMDAGIYGKDLPINHVIGFGHIGDEPWIYEWTEKHNGSISAEHGLGLMKAKYLRYSKSSSMINIMKKMKKELDPNGIMNPYKFLID